MEESRTVPSSLTPSEAESFFATGLDARSAAPGLPGCLTHSTQGSQGGSRGTGAAGTEHPTALVAGGPANQADGFAGGAASDLRCGECGNFRHASPRHKLGCRYAGQNCPGCAYAGDAHIASCPSGMQLKLPSDTCCDGVDMPGAVAPVHSPDCPNTRPVLRASHTYTSQSEKGGTPEEPTVSTSKQATLAGRPVIGRPAVSTPEQPATAEVQKLLGKLLFAASELANQRVMLPVGCMDKGFCLECGGLITRLSTEHGTNCRTGRVLELVATICTASPALATEGGVR